MGVMLSVLCSYMGALELVFIVRDLTHQLALHQMQLKNGERKQSDISVLQDQIKASIDALETVDLESVEQMQDGVLYKNGYRIDNNEQSIDEVAQQWDERRKVMCVAEVNTLESLPKSTVSNGNGIQYERTKTQIDDEPNEQNNYRPIVRDDRTGRKKAFKKRHSSDSSDSIRLSREEELKVFTSLEEEEDKNSKFTPITYSNASSSHKHIDSSFHEKQKYDAEAWSNKKPNNYHDSELWKRERATSIEEEREDNSTNTNTTKRVSSNKRPGANGTADKPTRKTSCENDQYASDKDACKLLDKVDNDGLCTPNPIDEKIANESQVAHQDDMQTTTTTTTTQPIGMIRKTENLPNLHQYFNEALDSVEHNKSDEMTPQSPILMEKSPTDTLRSRDTRSTTVYSRSDSDESSRIAYNKSITRDSSSTNNDSDYLRQRYSRTDSSNSFIQDELDSEEYHHNYRFSMTAETLEYIRGRDDWIAHTESKLKNEYRRLSSNISIREEIDSDEYHHDRKLSDLVEIAYLDSEAIKSLPSSFEGSKVFDRYYLELQQIKGQLSNDIERNVAQKQIVLLDSNEIEPIDGYVYPLPDIILDQVNDHGEDTSYAIEQSDSDYSNLSESEDDIQSVIEVTHAGSYAGEIITTLDMSGDDDEMIEVTLWDLNEDATRDFSSMESSVEIISIPSENLMVDQGSSDKMLDGTTDNTERADMIIGGTVTSDTPYNQSSNDISSSHNDLATNEKPSKEQFVNKEVETVDTLKSEVLNNIKSEGTLEQKGLANMENMTDLEESTIKTESTPQNETEDEMLRTAQKNPNHHRPPTGIEASKSFIDHEAKNSSSSTSSYTNNDIVKASKKTDQSKKTDKPKKSNENIDDLIKEGCMGVWFHN